MMRLAAAGCGTGIPVSTIKVNKSMAVFILPYLMS
jgi:hypothetical protein